MIAARNKADGVAKLLIEAKADLDATNKVRLVGVHIYMYMRGGWLVVGRAGRAVFIIAACMHACMRACMCRGAEIAHSLGALISPTTFTTTGTAAVMACAGWMDGADGCRTKQSRWRGEAAGRGEGGPGCDRQEGASRGQVHMLSLIHI